MNTILDQITELFLPNSNVSWTLKENGKTPVLSLVDAVTIKKISQLFTSLNVQLDDKMTITTGRNKKDGLWTIILQNLTMEKLAQIHQSLTLDKLIDGGFQSDHGCAIPHRDCHKQEVGRSNRNAVYLKLGDGRILEVPENIHHYINPTAHREYASFMPNLAFITWALSPSLDIIDCSALPEGTAVDTYGYISYVKKDGYLDCGISDGFAYLRKGSSFFYPDYATQLVMTNRTDSNVIEKTAVQKSEYSDLCQAVSSRFEFQIILYNPTIVRKLRAAAHQYDQEKLNHLGRLIKAFLSAGGESSDLFSECKKYLQVEPKSFHALDFNVGSNKIKLSRAESAIVYAMLTSRYFEPFTLDMKTLSVRFADPCENVIAQFAAYDAECSSSLGYQSPQFSRTPAKGKAPEPDSDDEFAAKGEECSIM